MITTPFEEAEELSDLGMAAIGISDETSWRDADILNELAQIRWMGRVVKIAFCSSLWSDSRRVSNLYLLMDLIRRFGGSVAALVVGAIGNQRLSEHLSGVSNIPRHGRMSFPGVVEVKRGNKIFSSLAALHEEAVLAYVRREEGARTYFLALYSSYLRFAVEPISRRHFGMCLRKLGFKYTTVKGQRIYLDIVPAKIVDVAK